MSRRDDIKQVAISVPFDNNANGFEHDNTQEAIEEIDFRQETKEPTGFVNRVDSSISFDDSTRTFTIAPVGERYEYLCEGIKIFKYSTESIQISDTEGIWFFYFIHETLTTTQTPWTFGSENVFIANGYWDADNNKMILFGEERHGVVMDWATHARLHRTDGAKTEPNGFTPGNYNFIGDGSLDSHCQLSIGNGYLNDEDIRMFIQNSATPTNLFEQKLSTIAWLPVYYKLGPIGYARKQVATAFPVYSNSPNTIYFNNYNTGTSQWELKNVTNNWYTAMWIIATNNLSEPIICLMGQYEAPSYILADNYNTLETLDITNFPSQEYKLLYRIIVQTSTSYTNTPKAVLRAISDASTYIINNDRYSILYSLNGNATTGKYLEIFPGQTTDTSPYVITEGSYVRSINLRTTANSTGVMAFYRFSNLTTPFTTISFTNQTYAKINLTEFIPSDEGITVKVLSGSFNKPHGTIVIQTGIS